MKRLFYLLVFVVISVKADMLVLKDGKEINGKLISIEKNILTFSTDNKEITEELSNVIRLKFQKMREGGTAETIDKLPDKWLRNRIKKGLPTTKDYPDSGSIILRNNTIVTLTSPQIWTIQKQKTILILKERGRRRAIRTLNYFHDYEKAEIIHAWSIAPNGKVLHLQDNSMTREKIYSSSPRYNSVTRIRFSMQGTDIGSIIDIKSKERRIKPREFDTFYMETPFTSSIPAEKETITIITPSKKQWSLDYHISNNLSSLKNQITYSKTVEN
ncbi:MAG: DUF3857 domain-containing protein, partial [Verrucomicrobiota bacterium]|nr:DUF3857 domain-containing protein [Verrucomicrobiota bacterium]